MKLALSQQQGSEGKRDLPPIHQRWFRIRLLVGAVFRIISRKECVRLALPLRGKKMAEQIQSHAVVWIENPIAKIFFIGLTGVGAATVRAHKVCTIGASGVNDDSTFLVRVGSALSSCTDLLIVGPETEKTKLTHFLRTNRRDLTIRLETSHPSTDREIVALGRKRFRLD
ncbi:hypothetical protein NLM27_25370 [Bradyrhizobium sp. CCGB12]|uniref:hypothetical protein n=1 Tax=Bradyrhizobium sp. CCGB12 TaxID=2949632 RepID=UPI0020B3E01B|nr:hypothetical protein [Bradyrhizobium sp. CCGB12]MCP3392120.1 hypothetical protein [Bradyrhizobium sp. CCGB12]